MSKINDCNKDLPFFAYGLFKNGELGFHQIKEYVEKIDYCEINGKLYERDGIPLLDEQGDSYIKGQLIFFKPGENVNAYSRIVGMEPSNVYKWIEIDVDGIYANVLRGVDIDKGSYFDNKIEWSGRSDPYFSKAIDVISSIQDEWSGKSISFNNFDYEPQLRLQMAYMLLWSSIERYATLKYKYKGSIESILKNIDQESAFVDGLKMHVKANRQNKTIYRSFDLDKYKLNPENPTESREYYYQVRCNSTHRGKSAPKDFEILKDSLEELLNIFKLMLDESFKFDESFSSKKFS
jgi:hypothetical protein